MQLKNNYFFLSLVFIFGFAWVTQSSLNLHWDILWGLEETKRLLSGGNYVTDFFEPSPPMFLYLYTIPILLQKSFSFKIALLFRLYIFFIISFVLFISNKVFSLLSNHSSFKNIMLLALAVLLLNLPLAPDFGQREHLFFIFIIPYFLLVATRLQQPKKKQNTALTFTCGLLAGIGAAIKPYFPLVIIIIEVYYALKQKHLAALLRSETVTIISVLAIYSLVIWYYHPAYFKIITPFMLRYHIQSYHFSWFALLSQPLSIFCIFIFLLYLFGNLFSLNNSHKNVASILFVANIGFFVIYFLQRTPWEYRLYPWYANSLWLLILLFYFLFQKNKNRSNHLNLICSILIFSFPFYYAFMYWKSFIDYNKSMHAWASSFPNLGQNSSFYFLTATMANKFTLLTEFSGQSPSKYPHMAWLAGITKKAKLPQSTLQYRQSLQDGEYLINSIANELNFFQPQYVFVDASVYKTYFGHTNFDFIKYFLMNKKFMQAWRSYEYFVTVENQQSKFIIYRRIYAA